MGYFFGDLFYRGITKEGVVYWQVVDNAYEHKLVYNGHMDFEYIYEWKHIEDWIKEAEEGLALFDKKLLDLIHKRLNDCKKTNRYDVIKTHDLYFALCMIINLYQITELRNYTYEDKLFERSIDKLKKLVMMHGRIPNDFDE